MPFEAGEQIRARSPDGHSNEQLSSELKELRAKLDMLGQHVAARIADVSSEDVHKVISARAVRLQLFADGLFADPAWDMLLHLYAQELDHRRVTVSQLCKASSVPPTTALRHIKLLELHGLICRRADGLDGRRVWMELSSPGSSALRRYFLWLAARK